MNIPIYSLANGGIIRVKWATSRQLMTHFDDTLLL